MPELPSPLIDILSAESFAAEHLPGSVNICVYEGSPHETENKAL
jgi:hypothetical protein